MTVSKRSWLTVNNDFFLSTLGLARRAGKLCRGFDSNVENMDNIAAVFLASDCSKRTRESITELFEQAEIHPITVNYTKTELGYAIGTKPVGILGVTDDGFAKLLKTRLSKEVIE